MRVHAWIGSCHEAELQTLEVDIEVLIDLERAAANDCLADTVDYAELACVIFKSLGGSRHPSLRVASSCVAGAVLAVDKRLQEIRLTLRNPRIVLDPAVDQVGVSIVQRRE
ncbi:MAG: dihydroneopterin aldolase [Proteobacteria bacterium]|nr:dihydroneopterin aldolase [Pseudomonadota bacterium]